MTESDSQAKIARLLADLNGITDDEELAKRYNQAQYSLARDPSALLGFLAQAKATGLSDRVSEARDRYLESLAEAVKADHKRRWDAALADAFEMWRGEQDQDQASHGNQALEAAERQMTEHERELFAELFGMLADALVAADLDREPVTSADIDIGLSQLMAENPRACELASRLGPFMRFRGPPDA